MYLWVVSLTSIAVLAWIAATISPLPDGGNLAVAGELVLLAVVAQHFPLPFGPQHKTDTSIAVYFALLLLFGAPAAVVLVGISQLLGQCTLALRRAPDTGKRRRGARGVLFNTSQLVIAMALTGAVYAGLTPARGPHAFGQLQDLWAIPAAAAVISLTNTLAVAAMVSLQLHRPLLTIWSADWRERAVERGGLLLMAVIGVLATGQAPWAPLLMAVPTSVLFLAQRRGVALLAAEQGARTDAVRAQAQLALLAQASAALAASLDVDTTLNSAVRLAVPSLADCSAISVDLGHEPRRITAVAHADPAQRERWHALLARGLVRLRSTSQVGAELYASVGEEHLAAWAADDEALQALREFGLRSAMVLPLLARGRSIGTLALYRAGSRRERFGASELSVAEDLAQRVALAIDNAALYEEQQRIVARLQQLRGQLEAAERDKLLGDERERIARELHDRVEQTFFSIGITVNALLASQGAALPASSLASLAHIHSSARQGAEELRGAIFALTRTEVFERGLVPSLWQLVRDFQERTGLEADLVESGAERRTSPEVREVLHAVAREGLANAEQHARATAVVVSLRFEDDSATLTVQDDGEGASALLLGALGDSVSRFGLRTIRDRVQRLGGTFSADRGEDGGFVLRVRVPLYGPGRS